MASCTHVVLIGLMGSGKTTVGRIVADALGWPLVDSDSVIEARTGRTVSQLQAEIGADAMHRLEAEQLLEALGQPGPMVVGAAASTIEVPACRDGLRAHGVLVAWLAIRPGTAAARFSSAPHRPSFGPDTAVFLAEQSARRDPLFRAAASVIIDMDVLDPAAAAARILDAVAAGG